MKTEKVKIVHEVDGVLWKVWRMTLDLLKLFIEKIFRGRL